MASLFKQNIVKLAVRGGNDTVGRGDKLQLHLILRLKALRELDARLVVIRIGLADIVLKKARAGARLRRHTRLDIGVIVRGHGQRQRGNAQQNQRKDKAQRVAQPAFLQSLCLLYSPHL